MHVFISFLKYYETLCIRGIHEIVLRVIVDRRCIEKVYLKKERQLKILDKLIILNEC